MFKLRIAIHIILLLCVTGYGYATEQSPLPISRHPAKVVQCCVLPVTPDMAGEVEVIHRSEGRVQKDTLLLRINPEELALDEQELEFISKLPPERRMYVVRHLKAAVDDRAMALLERKIAVTRENARLSKERLQKAFEKKRKLREITMPFDGRIQYHATMPEGGQAILLRFDYTVLRAQFCSLSFVLSAA